MDTEKTMNTENIREHMKVVGSDGEHVGMVDKLDGNSVKLAKNDPHAAGAHHWIPQDWIASVDSEVRLSKPGRQARNEWRDSSTPGDHPSR